MLTPDEREILLSKLEGFTGTLENVHLLTDKTLARILVTIYYYSKLDPVARLGKPLAEKLEHIGRV
jgi:hypothetical protein